MPKYIAPTLQQLRLFEAVARHGSVTRAAEEVHLTQPSVSMQVRALEDKIGLPLTEQIGKTLHLTRAGKAVAEASRDILGRMAELEQALRDLEGEVAGPLSVAVVSSAKYVVPQLLGAFKRRFPKVEPHLEIANRQTVLARLATNSDDLCIMGQPPEGLSVVERPFLENVIVPVARADHPLTSETGIALARLAREPLIRREPGSGTRKAVQALFAEAGIEAGAHLELDDVEAIKQAVAAGLGVAFLSLHALRLELLAGEVAVLDVAGFPLHRQWYAVHREGKHLSNAARGFLDFLMAEGADEVANT
ncbi:LysR family transcriptional regulator [Maritimibacter fusiformis]|uniref:HTH-type transcriptional regulator CbbR n=1 Tax=Maritimibacter fusiformis TaxID=2603819 RepID=A0A5D0RNG2_9RHOB|nr:LysR family transcriptional regulator [Maritimibacter fusiformis]TYB82168.1 LysR family transcriptional regulator [Maritimibacter fusiformis]